MKLLQFCYETISFNIRVVVGKNPEILGKILGIEKVTILFSQNRPLEIEHYTTLCHPKIQYNIQKYIILHILIPIPITVLFRVQFAQKFFIDSISHERKLALHCIPSSTTKLFLIKSCNAMPLFMKNNDIFEIIYMYYNSPMVI